MIPPRLCPLCGTGDDVEHLGPGNAGNFLCGLDGLVFAGSDEEWERYSLRRRARTQQLALAASQTSRCLADSATDEGVDL